VQYVGVQLTSTAMSIAGGANQFNAAIKHMRTWMSLDAKTASSTVCLIGTNNIGTPGLSVIGETQGGVTTPDRCRIIGYHDNKYTSTSNLNYHVPCDEEFGWLQVHDVWINTVAGRIYHAINGCIIGVGTITASVTGATTNALGINRRPASATLGYGSMTVCGVQFSTDEPSAAMIANAWQSSPEVTMTNAVRVFCASDLGAAGSPAASSWPCRISGAVTLTVTGSPSLVAKEAPRAPIGAVEMWGDSLTVGRRNASAPYDSDGGYRQSCLATTNTAGRFMGALGQSVSSDLTSVGVGAPKTFDRRMSAAAGQSLGVNSGKLTTLAADMLTYSGPTNPRILAYGTNDLSYRVVTMGQSAADAAAALLTDVGSALALVRAGTVTSWVGIRNVPRMGTGGSGVTATVQAAVDLYNASLAASIASLDTTYGTGAGYGSVFVIDCCAAVTPTQAAADDVLVLYDKIHETDAVKLTDGTAMGARLLAAA